MVHRGTRVSAIHSLLQRICNILFQDTDVLACNKMWFQTQEVLDYTVNVHLKLLHLGCDHF